MIKVFLACFIFFAVVTQAQNAKIEGLLKALPSAKATQRISMLNELSAAYLKLKTIENLAIAHNFANEAFKLSKSNDFNKGAGEAQLHLGNIMLSSPDVQKQPKALQNFQAALALFKHSGTSNKMPSCMRSIGFCFHHIGALRNAIQYMDSAKHLYLQLKDTVNFINCLAFEGHCYFDIGNYRTAYALGMDAVKYSQNTNDTLCRMTALTHLVNLFLGAGLPETALDYYKKIIAYVPSVFQRQPIKNSILIWSLIIGGEAYLRLKQHDAASELVQYIPSNNTDTEYNLFLGHLQEFEKQHEKALFYFKRGFQLENQKGLVISSSRYANEIGRTYLLMNKFDSAKFYCWKRKTLLVHCLIYMCKQKIMSRCINTVNGIKV